MIQEQYKYRLFKIDFFFSISCSGDAFDAIGECSIVHYLRRKYYGNGKENSIDK